MASRCEQCGNDYDKSFEVTMPAALFFPLPASAGGAVKGGATNPGGKYVPYGGGVGKFHTNPGGKYVYRGYGSRFHTNPGGKYVYPGWSGM